MKPVNVRGTEIDLDKIQNPKLKRVAKERNNDFLFNYGDNHTDTHKSEYYHTDTNPYRDYKERGTHSDASRHYAEHTDRTRHSEYDDWEDSSKHFDMT